VVELVITEEVEEEEEERATLHYCGPWSSPQEEEEVHEEGKSLEDQSSHGLAEGVSGRSFEQVCVLRVIPPGVSVSLSKAAWCLNSWPR